MSKYNNYSSLKTKKFYNNKEINLDNIEDLISITNEYISSFSTLKPQENLRIIHSTISQILRTQKKLE